MSTFDKVSGQYRDKALCAFWRKTSVCRTAGTTPLSIRRRRTMPGPTNGRVGPLRRP